MLLQLLVRLIKVSVYSCLFETSVHSFNLSICPGMVGFGQSVLNAILLTNLVEEQLEGIFISGATSKLNAVIRQNRMDSVGNRFNQITKELCSHRTGLLFMQLGKNKL